MEQGIWIFQMPPSFYIPKSLLQSGFSLQAFIRKTGYHDEKMRICNINKAKVTSSPTLMSSSLNNSTLLYLETFLRF